MVKPLVMIVKEHGTNCENESKFAFEQAGATADIVHMNDWIDNPKKIRDYQIVMFPGGFSYGDDTGSAYAWTNRIKNNLHDDMLEFARNGKNLILGVCNGFQLLVNFGLLPGFDGKYDEPTAALMHNDFPRYQCRWVDLKVTGSSPWLRGIDEISLPIAHGEGKFYTSEEILDKMKKKSLGIVRYAQGDVCKQLGLPANPNGSIDDIAGLTDESGRILGMMPHPERAIATQDDKEGPGVQVFRNAVNYFTEG